MAATSRVSIPPPRPACQHPRPLLSSCSCPIRTRRWMSTRRRCMRRTLSVLRVDSCFHTLGGQSWSITSGILGNLELKLEHFSFIVNTAANFTLQSISPHNRVLFFSFYLAQWSPRIRRRSVFISTSSLSFIQILLQRRHLTDFI